MPDEPRDDVPGPDASGPDDRTPQQRLIDSLRRPSRAQLVVGLLLAALGFGGVTQVRSTELDNTFANYREQDLVDVLNTLTDASQRAQSEIARLEATRADLSTVSKRRKAALNEAERSAETLAILAGQVPVSGPGVRITVTETEGVVDVDSLLDTIQELRTGSAEAMEFNDQVRIVAESSVADGTGGVLVDGELLTSPYVLEVIGDPLALQGALVFPQGPIDQLEEDGATVEFELLSAVLIDSVRESTPPEYAEPDPEQ